MAYIESLHGAEAGRPLLRPSSGLEELGDRSFHASLRTVALTDLRRVEVCRL